MADLINHETLQWDVPRIQQLFQASDARKILSIPLRRRYNTDCLIWKFTTDGQYTVKSSYFHALGRNQASLPNIIQFLLRKTLEEIVGSSYNPKILKFSLEIRA